VLSFHQKIQEVSNSRIFFLEEVLGIYDGYLYPELREKSPVKIAGGEIVTTSQELNYRIGESWYNIAQPDATVIGGITAVLEVFEKAKVSKTEVFVHCWGGPVCMAANYHAALASGGKVAEWPMPAYPLRNEMMVEPWQIKNGLLTLSEQPGLGVKLTEEIEEKYRFREDAVYSCVADLSKMTGDEVWLD
jgi:L-alanine-DL-glutamate epimerase-like enolase superfamily enzyme